MNLNLKKCLLLLLFITCAACKHKADDHKNEPSSVRMPPVPEGFAAQVAAPGDHTKPIAADSIIYAIFRDAVSTDLYVKEGYAIRFNCEAKRVIDTAVCIELADTGRISKEDVKYFEMPDPHIYHIDWQKLAGKKCISGNELYAGYAQYYELRQKANTGPYALMPPKDILFFQKSFHTDVLLFFSYPMLNKDRDKAIIIETESFKGLDYGVDALLFKRTKKGWEKVISIMMEAT